MQEENLRKQEESMQKQVAMRRGTHLVVASVSVLVLYSCVYAHHTRSHRHNKELLHKTKMARVAAEIQGK